MITFNKQITAKYIKTTKIVKHFFFIINYTLHYINNKLTIK